MTSNEEFGFQSKSRMSESENESPGRYQRNGDFIEFAVRLGLLGFLIYWSFLVVRPILPLVIWSTVRAVALYPVYNWLVIRLGGRRRFAAALITTVSFLILAGPVIWLGFGLFEGVRTLSEQLGSGTLTIPPPSEAVKRWPLVGDQVYHFWNLASANLKNALAEAIPLVKPLGSRLLAMAGSASTETLKFLASVVVAGFLFAPGPSLLRALKTLSSRIFSARGEEFVELAGATIRSVSRGVIGISVLKALLAAIGLMIAHVPGASLLAFAVLVLGIIQIGPSVDLIPVIIWSCTAMETAAALAFTAYMVPVNLMDNILRPIIMARGLTTPMLVILIGVIGGTLAHGIIGLFLGPIILAIAWELLVAWIRGDQAILPESILARAP